MKRTPSLRSESGQALVEFALVAPLLLLLALGIAQFAIAFNHSLALTDAVRAGVRAAVVAGPDPASATAAAQAAVRDAATALDPAEVSVSVDPTATDVTVTATYPYAISILGLVVHSGQLSSTTKERFE